MSCISNTSCLGGSLFCSGLLVDLNRTGDSFYRGGEFFAEIQRGVRRTTAVGKRVDTCGFYPLNSRFPLFLSLAQTGDRRPLRKGERQRIFSSVCFSTYSQCQIPYCYTYGLLYAGATQGELPKGQEKVPWGITVLRNSFTRCYGQHLRIPLYQQTLPQGAPR